MRNINFIKKCFNNLNSDNIFYRYYNEKKKYSDIRSYLANFKKIICGERLKIVTFSDKSFEMYSTIISIFLTNNIWIPLSFNLPLKRIIKILNISNPDIIILENYSLIKNNNFFSDYIKKKKIKIYLYKDFKKKKINFNNLKIPTYNLDDISMIFFTSGSTGDPKGVLISYNNFISCFNSKKKILYDKKKNLIFGDYHDPSFVISLVILFPCLYLKSTISPSKNVYETLDPIEHIKKNKVNVLITVPSTIEKIKELKKYNNLKDFFYFIIMCGEPFSSKLAEFIINEIRPKKLFNFYGSTEVSPWIFYYQLNKKKLKELKEFEFVPVGMPLENVKIKIINRELLVSGPVVTRGYIDDKQNKEAYIVQKNNNWFRTKDQIFKFKNQYFVKGRIDNVIKIQGYRVDLGDIEKNIRKISKVEEVLVYLKSISNRKILSCVIKSKLKISKEEIAKKLQEDIPSYMIPKRIFFKKNFSYNRSGKIDRKKLMI